LLKKVLSTAASSLDSINYFTMASTADFLS